MINRTLVAILALTTASVGFGKESLAQSSPVGWVCGSTGGGTPNWSMTTDSSATQVLKQSGKAPFPWCVKPGVKLADGFVEVRFKPLSGREDQAGGVMWRWQDGDNYYVARANALENNLSLYYTQAGRRYTIRYVDVPVAPNIWHSLRVEYRGVHINVLLDGQRYIEFDDDHISAPGLVGVWTKADSVTVFDEFRSGSARSGRP
ncbi:MAG: hypothetical protein NTY41_07415 [Proteobacteria bacterium]|nr:hypothetical protein [Pseudomonadota bacterium]